MTKLIILTEKMSPDWTILSAANVPAANVVQMWCICGANVVQMRCKCGANLPA